MGDILIIENGGGGNVSTIERLIQEGLEVAIISVDLGDIPDYGATGEYTTDGLGIWLRSAQTGVSIQMAEWPSAPNYWVITGPLTVTEEYPEGFRRKLHSKPHLYEPYPLTPEFGSSYWKSSLEFELGYSIQLPDAYVTIESVKSPSYTSSNSDILQDTGISTAVYMSLFTDKNWSDDLLPSADIVSGAGDFEASLGDPIAAGSIARMQQLAVTQLGWMQDNGVVEDISVKVSNPRLGVLQIDIIATEPNAEEDTYRILWDQKTQRIISEVRNNG